MIGVGPFSIQVVIVAGAATAAWLVAHLLARRLPVTDARPASSLIVDALLAGLIVARIVFIGIWWQEYSNTPWSMLAIGDGGFHGLAGLLAATVWIGWKTRSSPQLRKPVYAGMLAGVLVWGLAANAPRILQLAAPSLPALQLNTIDYEETVALTSFTGQPVVVNLWATWCPPCRREMPVLQQAQNDYPGIAIVLINQGESSQQIRAFLESENLQLDNVLLDPFSSVMREVGSRGLPTTLYFDADGRMVDSHLGELTMPGLRSTLNRHFDLSSPTNPKQE